MTRRKGAILQRFADRKLADVRARRGRAGGARGLPAQQLVRASVLVQAIAHPFSAPTIWAAGWVANATRFSVLCGTIRLEPADSLSRATRLTSFETGINHFLEGQMRSLKLGLAAAAVICALSATAQADCIKVEVARRSCDPRYRRGLCDARSRKHYLWQGSRGEGPCPHEVRRWLRDNDVSLLADGVQRHSTPYLLRRLALPAHVTPMPGANEE